MEELDDRFYNCALLDGGPVRHETCRSLRIKTLPFFRRSVCSWSHFNK